MPKELEAFYKEYVLKWFIPDYLGFLFHYKYFYYEEEEEERRLSNDEEDSKLEYEISIEYKDGKVIKYNTKSDKLETISEGSGEETGTDNNYSKYLTLLINQLLFILILLV